ncbi:LacI family DNA-binding transcriptional regulator [Actinocorallia lasiicapitis]
MTSRRPTIEDVARAVGVSRQTVSRALNDQGRIDPETKRKVLAAVAELGYRPSRFARGLVRQDTVTVGVVVPPLTNPFFPELVTGITSAVRAWDGQVLLGVHDGSPSDALSTLERVQSQCDALIVAVPDAPYPGITLPVVRVDGEVGPPDWPAITIDYPGGASLALAHLAARGHRTVAVIDSEGCAGSPRRVSFVTEAPDHGLTCAGVAMAPETFAGGTAAMTELVAAHPEVTAVFAFNDVIAVGALRAAGGRAVIGCDDLLLAEVVTPPLTTVRIDTYRLGELAADRLRALLNGDQPGDSVLPCTLTVRASA